jgi:hypothetical protein
VVWVLAGGVQDGVGRHHVIHLRTCNAV